MWSTAWLLKFIFGAHVIHALYRPGLINHRNRNRNKFVFAETIKIAIKSNLCKLQQSNYFQILTGLVLGISPRSREEELVSDTLTPEMFPLGLANLPFTSLWRLVTKYNGSITNSYSGRRASGNVHKFECVSTISGDDIPKRESGGTSSRWRRQSNGEFSTSRRQSMGAGAAAGDGWNVIAHDTN